MTHVRSFLRCAAAATVLGGISAPSSAQKFPDLRLDRAAFSSALSPRVAAVGSAVYVVWTDDRNGYSDIYFNRSLDGGNTWLAGEVRLDTDAPGANLSRSPRIAVSGSTVWVVWSDTRNSAPSYDGDVYVNYSTDRGDTWLSREVRLDTDAPGTANSGDCEIAAVGSSVYVVWRDARNSPFSSGRDDIYFNRSLDGGATWLASDVRLDTDAPGAANSWRPRIAAAGSAVYVTWEEQRAGAKKYDVHFNGSLDGGTTWLPHDVRLDTDAAGANNSFEPEIAAAGTAVHVVWVEQRNPANLFDIYLNRSLDGGLTWLASDQRLDQKPPGNGSSTDARVVAVGAAVYVAWEDSRESTSGSSIYLRRSLDGGSSWLGEKRLDVGLMHSRQPRIVAEGTGVHVAWTESFDVVLNRSLDRGASWLATPLQLDITSGFTGSSLPELAVSGGAVHVSWQDDRNGDPDVYFNIPFGAQPYGSGKAGSGAWTPTLNGVGSATIGSTVSMDVTDGLGGASGVYLVGGSGARIVQPLLGGTLLVVPQLAVPFVLDGVPGAAGTGTTALPVVLPNDASLVGEDLYFQALILDPGASFGVSLSRGVELWIG